LTIENGPGEVCEVAVKGALERGRRAHATESWTVAFDTLSAADASTPLGGDDLELLAASAYMLGREDDYFRALERGHEAHLDAGDARRAVRCAFWLAANLAQRGEMGRASGWLGRARRLLEHEPQDCVERGYVLIQRCSGSKRPVTLRGPRTPPRAPPR
jgi:Flp pilus assembly protein TadD